MMNSFFKSAFLCRLSLIALCSALTCSTISLSYFIQDHRGGPFDTLYCPKDHSIFDQSHLIETDEFKAVPLSVQQDLLESNFHTQRAWAYASSIKDSVLTAWPLVPICLLAYSLRKKLEGMSATASVASAMLITPLIQQVLEKPIMSILNFVEAIQALSSKTAVTDELERNEIEYVRNKPWIPKAIQRSIEEAIRNGHCRDPETYGPGSDKNTLLKVIKTGLNLPFTKKTIVYDSDLIDKTLQGYSEQTTLELKRYCVRHCASSTAHTVRKIAAYFWGEPGVGKTRAAKLVAKALGLPCQVISFGEVTIEKLIGDETHPGLLLEVLARQSESGEKASNMIIVIDEADRVLFDFARAELLAFSLMLLDPETTTFYSPYLKAEVDISNLGIIMTGKTSPTDDALNNRLHVVPFDGYTREYKKDVVWNELYPSILSTHEQAALKLKSEDFTQEDIDAINDLIDKDTDKGFRSIKLKLMNYFEDRVLRKYFGNVEAIQSL